MFFLGIDLENSSSELSVLNADKGSNVASVTASGLLEWMFLPEDLSGRLYFEKHKLYRITYTTL